MKYQVHESAIVDAGVQIGVGSRVWHFALRWCSNRSGKVSHWGRMSLSITVTIGDNCKIQNNVSVYDNVHLEEEGVFCGPSMVFTNVYNPRSLIEAIKTNTGTSVAGAPLWELIVRLSVG